MSSLQAEVTRIVHVLKWQSPCSFLKFHQVLLTYGYSNIITVADCTRREAEEDKCAHAVDVGIG